MHSDAPLRKTQNWDSQAANTHQTQLAQIKQHGMVVFWKCLWVSTAVCPRILFLQIRCRRRARSSHRNSRKDTLYGVVMFFEVNRLGWNRTTPLSCFCEYADRLQKGTLSYIYIYICIYVHTYILTVKQHNPTTEEKSTQIRVPIHLEIFISNINSLQYQLHVCWNLWEILSQNSHSLSARTLTCDGARDLLCGSFALSRSM